MRLVTGGDLPVPVAVWYPSGVETVPWDAGPYAIHATRDAPIAPGRHGLILLSHGSGGGEFAQADLAESLARRGYVVAAPRHLGDSYDQPDGRGSDVQLVGRPWQAVETLDAVLADPRLRANIDEHLIGMAGFSAGGYTTLVMAGAIPDMRLLQAYCRASPDDAELCLHGAASTERITRPGWPLPQDHRVRAAVLMAPLGVIFDAHGLASVTIPLLVYKARDDSVLRNNANTDHLIALLSSPPGQGTVNGDHYVFLAPCNATLTAIAPQRCVDAPGVDRLREHQALDDEIGAFFDRELRPAEIALPIDSRAGSSRPLRDVNKP